MKGDEYYMRLALEEAERARASGEVPVGAVLVVEERIIARDHNRTEQLCDPTAHAEMLCLTAACTALQSKYLAHATLYVTLEPCAMCAAALGWAQIGGLVYGASDPQKGFTRYTPALLHPRTRVRQGLLAEAAQYLLQEFFRSRR
ncbi:MAG: nucleoside deaminase [Bacteroidia bacterium]|nr:nucleoside deaminase [Bacteroidia bacterium]MDW8088992.1 nucleoside deaminase [Bacteroidia bacterium]